MMWIPATLIAAAAQTARNAAQKRLTAEIGTMGATGVRFLFGLPFAVLFLALAAIWLPVPTPDARVLGFAAMGAVSQIGATALMLVAMEARGFAVTTALIKTEPVSIALLGVVLLGDRLGVGQLVAIAIATTGVLLVSGIDWSKAGIGSVATGLAAGVLFGLSAIGFRGAIIALPDGGFLIRATLVLVISLVIQTVLVMAWLVLFDRKALSGMAANLRESLGAGFLGAFASQFWFIGFALTAAANVRTLALIEVVFARLISGRIFSEATSRRQLAGMALIVIGVGWLLRAA